MEPIIKEYSTFSNSEEADAFLQASPLHFIWSVGQPDPDLDLVFRTQVIVLGKGKQAGYTFLPESADKSHITTLCRLILKGRASEMEAADLASFLQGFVGQLKDKVGLEEVARNVIQEVSNLFDAEGAAVLLLNENKDSLRFVATHSAEDSISDKLSQIAVPLDKGIAGWVATNRKPLLVNKASRDTRFSDDVDKQTDFSTRDLLAAPIVLGDDLIGVLEVVNCKRRAFNEWDLPTLSVLASVVAIFLEKAQLVVQNRKYRHLIGKAEIATSVLHNIANVLNSVTVGCGTMASNIEHSPLKQLLKVNKLIEKHKDQLGTFFEENPKGKLLPDYLHRLALELKDEQETLLQDVGKVLEKAHLMKGIIETQQTIAKVGPDTTQDIIQIIEEALGIQEPTLENYGVEVIRDYKSDQPIRGQKSKLVHILINLIKNGAEAMADLPKERRILRISTGQVDKKSVFIQVEDHGYGFPAEVRRNLFQHGFTTKETGHGFGLNYCAKAMEEMNGSIEAASEGSGLGARFILQFPSIVEQDVLRL